MAFNDATEENIRAMIGDLNTPYLIQTGRLRKLYSQYASYIPGRANQVVAYYAAREIYFSYLNGTIACDDDDELDKILKRLERLVDRLAGEAGIHGGAIVTMEIDLNIDTDENNYLNMFNESDGQ